MNVVEKNERIGKAIELLLLGFRPPIVVIETNLKSSVVRDVYRSLFEGQRASAGSLPTPNYFIKSLEGLAEASVFAGIYHSMAGESAFETIDIDDLVAAHKLFLEIRGRLGFKKDVLIDINRAWVIARDLRSGLAWMRYCEKDQAYFLAVDGQKTLPGCPWCSMAGRQNKSPKNK